MSVLTTVLAIIAGALLFASIAGIYITNVTAKPGGIPRWVMALWAATLLVAVITVLTMV
ncbi:hypothetical protein Bfae_02390 [Brachybacterium faecium DSM 4810]|uniref:Uncharacterized protein n=1 Tax=Brachybacterium faecium (strain ATCC 43885 / DSM 4810 / JCM 11609 / LMG 19847 / NBRC 14762 / NCIMB 9860 / 6-10) TaxID=446465 RepID=C7MFZ9_BRAFD|nr:hypothetical protein [Brachybacterium faecium]ACU84117.1 hypothetical protein Bfae_02390 [Brachybacterium faecium DSM 4810]